MSVEHIESPYVFPDVWRSGHREVPSRFAIWFPSKQTYQVVITNREHYPLLEFSNTLTERTDPYYFAKSEPDEASRNISILKPRSRSNPQITVGIWFTGGWLCRKAADHLDAVMPIMGVTDISKFSFQGNVGLHTSPIYYEWLANQSPIHTAPIIMNRLSNTSNDPTPKKAAIPTFVADALVQSAIAKDETCPISMESYEIGKHTTAVTSCYHIFQKSALDTWLERNTCCPVCKQTLGEYTVI